MRNSLTLVLSIWSDTNERFSINYWQERFQISIVTNDVISPHRFITSHETNQRNIVIHSSFICAIAIFVLLRHNNISGGQKKVIILFIQE